MTDLARHPDTHAEQDRPMRITDLTTSSSLAAMVAAFPRGPRIAFAPETGAGGGAVPARKPDAVPKRDAARKDEGTPAEGDDKMDRLLSALQSITEGQTAISARLDALEKAKEGTESADDLTEAEREEIAKNDGIGAEMDAIRARMPLATRLAADKAREDAVVRSQVRADTAWNMHGKRAPAPLVGETPVAYRVRLANELRRFSPALKDVSLDAIARADEAGFAALEDRIYADSAEASKRPEGPADGGLMMRERYDRDMNRNVREYFGRHIYAKLASPEAQRFHGFRIQPQMA